MTTPGTLKRTTYLQPIEKVDTQRIVSQPLKAVKTTGDDTCTKLNTFLQISGAIVWLWTPYMGPYQVVSVQKLIGPWIKCYVITPQNTHDTLRVPWWSNFQLSLGTP